MAVVDEHRALGAHELSSIRAMMKQDMTLPLSTIPGEQVLHVYQGPMEAETIHFIDAVALDRPVLITPEQARQVMEVTHASDLSAERHPPVTLPLE